MKENDQFYLPSFQGYGDFIVTLYIKKLFDAGNDNIKVISSDNCFELGNQLGVNNFVDYLNVSGPDGYPAFIDIKRQGWKAGLNSLLKIRKKIALNKSKRQIIFHSSQVKEILMGIGRNSTFLYGNENIYLKYEKFFKDKKYFENPSILNIKFKKNKRIKIFPISQNKYKTFPIKLQKKLSYILDKNNLEYEFIFLDGEEKNYQEIKNKKIIDKSFYALIQEIKDTDCIISCDSLPSHLGEYLEKKVYVIFPKQNCYWLPPTAFRFLYWSIFIEANDSEKFSNKLLNFIKN